MKSVVRKDVCVTEMSKLLFYVDSQVVFYKSAKEVSADKL